MDYLNALELVGSCRIETADYDGALSTFTEMYIIADRKSFSGNGGRVVGVFSDILARCEVTRVLLLLLLQVIRFEILRLLSSMTCSNYVKMCII